MVTNMETEIPNINEYLDVRSANDCMVSAKEERLPNMLFGDMWLEGELAMMVSDTGRGKSLLAVQIAESIARGSKIRPFEMTAEKQKVLYLEFEMSDKQFEMRYTAEPNLKNGGPLRRHYRFSDDLKRVVLRPEVLTPQLSSSLFKVLPQMIEPLVAKYDAKVLIIDNITYLRRTAQGTSESIQLMKELKRIKDKLGLSILVLAQTPQMATARRITAGGLHGLKAIADIADNIFAIGQSGTDAETRYIKHIRARSRGIVFGTAHVPAFRIARIGGNFLGFDFRGFASELALLHDACEQYAWANVDRVRRMLAAGMSVRQIAHETSWSKSKAGRYVQLANDKPKIEGIYAGPPPVEAHDLDEGEQPIDYSFPGREEYDAALADPRFDVLYDTEDEENFRLRREAYAIDHARASARKIYLETGVAPTLAEMLSIESQSFDEPEDEPLDPVTAPGEPVIPNASRTPSGPIRDVRDGEEYWYEYTRKGAKIRWETRRALNRTPIGIVLRPGQSDPMVPYNQIPQNERPREVYEFDKSGKLRLFKINAMGRSGSDVDEETMPRAEVVE